MTNSEKIIRKSREERTEVKTEERATKRVRPSGAVNRDRTAIPDAIRKAYPDCVFFWENNEKGAVQQREARGWEIVRGSFMADGSWNPAETTALGSAVSQPVGMGETTNNMDAVLMMLPREWYEDDLREQEENNRQLENSLRRGSTHGEISPDGTYAPRLPDGSIGYSRKLGTR